MRKASPSHKRRSVIALCVRVCWRRETRQHVKADKRSIIIIIIIIMGSREVPVLVLV
jgi:hypothetical protein